jgi:hypothetical protein
VRNLRGLSAPFLRIDPRGSAVENGHSEWSANLSVANSSHRFTNGIKQVVEDYEIDRLTLRYRKGLPHGEDITFEAPFEARGGGLLDPFISFWHRAIVKFSAPFRENSPMGQSILTLPGHATYGDATGLGDVSVSLAKQLRSGVTGVVAVKIPTGNSRQLLGSGAVDLAVAAIWHRPLRGRADLHLQAGLVFQGRSPELQEARSTVWQGSYSLSYRLSKLDHVIVQGQLESAAITTGVRDADQLQSMASVGLRRTWKSGDSLDVFLCEDGDWLGYNIPIVANLAPDLTLGIHYTRRF